MRFFKKKKLDRSFFEVRTPAPPKVHKHQVLVPLLTFIVLGIFSGFLFLIYGGTTVEGEDVQRVQLYVDGQKRTLPTRAPTVGELLKRLDIQLAEGDIVEPGPNSPIDGDDIHINVYRAKPVTVVDEDGKKVTAKIAESTPESLAKKAGFSLYPEDKASFAEPDIAINDGVVGELVTIERSVPVTINLYGNVIPTRTLGNTVGELLKEKNIQTLEGDTVVPNVNTPITPDMTVLVLRDGKQVFSVEETIPPPTETQQDATLDIGVTKVLEPGVPGKRVVTYEVEFKDDKEIGRKILQSVVAVQPQKRVVVMGAKKTGFGGGFDAALARLRSCEGSYSSNTGNGYYGAYQFNLGTWRTNAPAGYQSTLPSDAPPAVQDQAAATLYQRRGWQPWPSCSRKMGLQDIYR